jgi:hypothetical protein
MRLFKLGDILLGLVFIGIGYWAIFRFSPGGNASQTALIQIDNNIEYELSLNKTQTVALNEFNPPVEIKVQNNSIGIIQNDCEQKICVRMGFISHPGEMIVCVPKKILIYIPFSNGKQSTIKAITG